MKRRILFAALMSLLLITSCNAKKTHDTTPKRQGYREWELDRNLYGDVDSVTITNYKFTDKFGELVKDRIINKDVYKFNLRGDVVEMIGYNSDGSLMGKILHKYDSQGNMIEEASYNGDGSLREKSLYKYDSQGNKIEEARYNGDGSLDYKYLYKYDSQGNKIECISYYDDGSLCEKILYKYDSQGNMIEKIRCNGEIMKPDSKTEQVIVYRK